MRSSCHAALVCALVVSCSRNDIDRNADEPRAQAANQAEQPQEVQASPTPQVSEPTDDYPLSERVADDQIVRFVESMMRDNDEMRRMIADANGATRSDEIGKNDRKQIGALIAAMEGFTPSRFGGDVYRFKQYTVVVIHGKVDVYDDQSVFLIKVGWGGWTVLGKLEG